VEFSLSSKVVVPGGELAGEIALYNTAQNRYKLLVLSLVGYETRRSAQGRGLGTVEAARYSIRLPVEQHGEAEPIPFRMVLPAEVAPSQRTQMFDVTWAFEITAKIAWASNLQASVPVVVLPKGSAAKPRQRLAAPAVGSARMANLWGAVAREHGLEFDRNERAIVGSRGEVSIRIERAHRGSDGIFLTAELRFAPLGLDIDGGVVSGIRRVIGGGVTVGVEEWDKRHYLGGREPPQIAAFARALGDSLTGVALRDVDDEHMLIELRDAGQSRSALARFATRARELARDIQIARKRVPPPASMADAVDAWRRLAERLRAELDTCSMRIVGKLDGSAVEVATHWSPKGDALHTALSLHAQDGIGERQRLVWAQGELREGSLEQLPRAAAARLETMWQHALSLTIASDRLVVWDPAPEPDDRRLLARLDELVQLAAALRGQHGPYR
jgi:hypothetical protein